MAGGNGLGEKWLGECPRRGMTGRKWPGVGGEMAGGMS